VQSLKTFIVLQLGPPIGSKRWSNNTK